MIRVFGDSISGYGYPAIVGAHFGETPSVTSIGGACVADLCNEVFAAHPASGDVTIIELGTNDKSFNAGDSVSRDAIARTGHLSLLLHAAIPAGRKVFGASMASVGTWAALSDVIANQGAHSSTNGSKKTATVAGSSVIVSGLWNSTQSGAFEVLIDGVSRGIFSASTPGAIPASSNQVWGPFALVFSGLSNASHTIEIRVSSATGGANCVYLHYVAGLDGLPVESAPMVVATGVYHFTTAADAARSITAGRVDRMNAYLERNVAICFALGLDVRFAQLLPDFDKSTCLGSDGIHPNATGDAVIASKVISAIEATSQPAWYTAQIPAALTRPIAGHVY